MLLTYTHVLYYPSLQLYIPNQINLLRLEFNNYSVDANPMKTQLFVPRIVYKYVYG